MMVCNGIFRWQRPFPLKKRLFSALRSLLVVLIILQFIACKDYETPDSYNVLPAGGDQVGSQTLDRVLKSEAYTPEEFLEHLGSPSFEYIMDSVAPQIVPIAKSLAMTKMQSHLPTLDRMFENEAGTNPDGSRRWQFESYTFSYHSRAVDGRDLVMSGRVTFPNNTATGIPHHVKTLSLHSHQAFLWFDWAPSESMMFMPLRSLWNSAVIEPDFQQWGINYGREAESCGSPLIQTQQMADCVVAALEVMRRHGVALASDGYSTFWGTSLSASVPFHFTKWYETEAPEWFRQAVRLRSVFSGEGPLDIAAFYEHFCSHQELFKSSFDTFFILPGAFSKKQLGGFEGKDFVHDMYNENHVTVNGTDYTLYEALSRNMLLDSIANRTIPCGIEFPSTLDGILPPDMLTPDCRLDRNSPKVQALLKTFRVHSDLSGWHPQTEIYFALYPEDRLIPYDQTRELFMQLAASSPNHCLHWLDVPQNNGMFDVLVGDDTSHFITSFMMLLFMSNAEEPKDMAKIYAGKQ